MSGDLAGRRFMVPESRELDLFARMLESQGAETLRCPLVSILDLEDTAPVRAWLDRLCAGAFDDVILLTGEGMRRMMAVARAQSIDAQVVEALGEVRKITRGPKPARALRELGLTSDLPAEEPTTEGVIASLAGEDLTGRTVGVQLYPGNPNDLLLDALRGAGAAVETVTPYRYATDAETEQVAAAIREMADGKVDYIAFTASPQVRRLQDVARDRGLEKELHDGLSRTRIAAVGPVVASAVEALGFTIAVSPESTFHMKPLVNAIRESLKAA
ncbi:uroporphyrinogen-III synthase [Azospirillum sp. SYSU D00513]|uniref:uroporphyrinogen-III synthase n=1 Tax=Azospirillum sp. SYSU D00513 TaxID=2812561 RepID=UPI001A97242E|nr:uroporphyrinogen-III synthase [Azospirillum sp. SYSU D00513]